MRSAHRPATLWLAAAALITGAASALGGSPPSAEPPARGGDAVRPSGASVNGYLLYLEEQNGRWRLAEAAEIANFVARTRPPSALDWSLRVLDSTGSSLWETAFPSPRLARPSGLADGATPCVVRIPALAGMSEAALVDERGREVARARLDGGFATAAAESRRRFLAWREASVRGATPVRVVEGASAAAGAGAQPHAFPRLSAPDRPLLAEALMADAEVLARFGPEVAREHALLREPAPRIQARLQAQRPGSERVTARSSTVSALTGPFRLTLYIREVGTRVPIPGASVRLEQTDTNGTYLGPIGTFLTGPDGSVSASVAAGSIGCWVLEVAGSTYVLGLAASLGVPIRGDTTAEILLYPGVTLRGTVRDTGGTPVASTYLLAGARKCKAHAFAVDGTFELVVPRGEPFTLVAMPPVPYAWPLPEDGLLFFGDAARDVTVERGLVVSGRVTDASHAPLEGVALVVRSLAPTSTYSWQWDEQIWQDRMFTNSEGRYAFAVPRWLSPREVALFAWKDGYVRALAGFPLADDRTQDFVLRRGVTVSGTVRDAAGQPIRDAKLRAYRGDELVASFATYTDGRYELSLEPGTYTFRVTVECWIDDCVRSFRPVEVAGVPVSAAQQRDFTLEEVAGTVQVTLWVDDSDPHGMIWWPMRVEVVRDGRLVDIHYVRTDWQLDGSSGRTFVAGSFGLEPGTYTIRAILMGNDPAVFENVDVAGTVALTADLPPPRVWTGTLRTADGTPVPDARIYSYEETQESYRRLATDAQGRFAVPLMPNGFIQLYAPRDGSSLTYCERLGPSPRSRNGDCVLDALPLLSPAGSGARQLYGTPDLAGRYNLVFIGDGYADVRESFTDRNGNGKWDGVFFWDVNSNGVWDGWEEPYAVYGDAAPPVPGSDPREGNEPFVDVNGDGVLSPDDQALFVANVADSMRSLLGKDVWRNHRDAFNAFYIPLVSRQAGHDFCDNSGNPIYSRDTALDSSFTAWGAPWIHWFRITQLVNELVPEWDTIVALVNMPANFGVSVAWPQFSEILDHGGPAVDVVNESVLGHELAHALGLLDDEYDGNWSAYAYGEPESPNTTTAARRELVPWRDLIPPDQDVPSLPHARGVGLFESAEYVQAQVYRPAADCAMRERVRFCPVCERQIEYRLAAMTGGPQGPLTLLGPQGPVGSRRPTFSWLGVPTASHYVLEIQREADKAIVGTYDVFGTSWTPEFDLAAGSRHYWRLRPAVEVRTGPWSAPVWFDTPGGACAGVAVSPAELPPWSWRSAVAGGLTAAGGSEPYTFEVTLGELPAGVSLAPNGRLSGAPSVVGSSVVTVTARDARGCSGSATYLVSVGARTHRQLRGGG